MNLQITTFAKDQAKPLAGDKGQFVFLLDGAPDSQWKTDFNEAWNKIDSKKKNGAGINLRDSSIVLTCNNSQAKDFYPVLQQVVMAANGDGDAWQIILNEMEKLVNKPKDS